MLPDDILFVCSAFWTLGSIIQLNRTNKEFYAITKNLIQQQVDAIRTVTLDVRTSYMQRMTLNNFVRGSLVMDMPVHDIFCELITIQQQLPSGSMPSGTHCFIHIMDILNTQKVRYPSKIPSFCPTLTWWFIFTRTEDGHYPESYNIIISNSYHQPIAILTCNGLLSMMDPDIDYCRMVESVLMLATTYQNRNFCPVCKGRMDRVGHVCCGCHYLHGVEQIKTIQKMRVMKRDDTNRLDELY
jgi:hypothetical protein